MIKDTVGLYVIGCHFGWMDMREMLPVCLEREVTVKNVFI